LLCLISKSFLQRQYHPFRRWSSWLECWES
jgi:hypothetical protein